MIGMMEGTRGSHGRTGYRSMGSPPLSLSGYEILTGNAESVDEGVQLSPSW